jgi:hypothetical protein
LVPSGRKDGRAPLVPRFALEELRFLNKGAKEMGTGELLAIEDPATVSKKASLYKWRAVKLLLAFVVLVISLAIFYLLDLGKGMTGTGITSIVYALMVPCMISGLFAYAYTRMALSVRPTHFYERGVVLFSAKRGTPEFYGWTFWKHYRWISHGRLGKVLIVGDRPSSLSLVVELDDMLHVDILQSMEGFDDVLGVVRRILKEWGG